MINKIIASLDLEATGSKETRVNMTMSYNTTPRIMGGVMKSQFLKMITNILVGLKYHLETGNLVTKKDGKGIMKAYKGLKGGNFEKVLETVAA